MITAVRTKSPTGTGANENDSVCCECHATLTLANHELDTTATEL